MTNTGEPLVLKLGGSLAESGRLAGLIDIIANATAAVVVVPGGGPFADAVRAIQPQLVLSDALSHRLALLAMHQMGHVIAASHPRFAPTETLAEIAIALAAGSIPVWLPYSLQHDDASLPADWTATSDALAARLAERLGSGSVALVKSCAVPKGATLDDVTTAGIADPVFGDIVRRSGLVWAIYGAGDEGLLEARLRGLGETAERSRW